MKKLSQKKLALFLASWFIIGGSVSAETFTDTVTEGPIANDTIIIVDGKPGIEPGTNDISGGENISITMTGADNGLAAINANSKTITLGNNLKINVTAVDNPVGTYSAIGIKAVGADSIVNLGSATITATGDNSLALYAKDTGTITGSGVYNITGDIIVDTNGIVNLTFESGSSFKGLAQTINDNTSPNTRLNLTFNNSKVEGNISGSTAHLTLNNSYVIATDYIDPIELILNNSVIEFQTSKTGILGTSNLTSNNGLLKLRIDPSSNPKDYVFDKFFFTSSASGNLFLQLTPFTMDIEPDTTAKYNVGTILSTKPNIEISLLNKVDIGSYQFELTSEIPSDMPFVTDYNLSYTGNYSTPVRVGPNASRAMYYLTYAEMNTLMQRMGDLRKNESKGDAWARIFSGKFDIDATNQFDLFQQEYTGVQIGIDKKLKSSEKADFYLGAMFGYTDGDNDYYQGSQGDTTSYYGGIYGLYHQPKNDFFVDTVLKYGSMKNEMKIFANGEHLKDDDKSNVWAFSVETGKRFYLSKNSRENKEGFYLEPQFQFTWGKIGSTDYNFAGLNLDVDSINTNMGRLGFLAGYEIKSGKNPINIYGKLSWVKEFDGELRAKTGVVEARSKIDDSWFVYGVGVTATYNNKHNIYLEFQKSSGGDYFDQDWQVNGGYRYSF
ncbi:autotransporter outer membrane beta-barrel domain-containing protein [Selenomonadales bacterium OttesenSCG-928-I06]|nr:autotransporter outer membrane beta-barrel domain-containing protein [Selenomonadales bacterium OttesenSCG-928-I06]